MAVRFRDLEVWQLAIVLAKHVYSITAGFPSSEKYGLVSQLRRAVVSISANIAEGHARGTRRDYCHFVSIALGSAREVDSLLALSVELGLVGNDKTAKTLQLLDRICGMLFSLRAQLNKKAG
ncbi:four helix bundle protein [bacterium]|nr:four helix bundle protein [bacterium]